MDDEFDYGGYSDAGFDYSFLDNLASDYNFDQPDNYDSFNYDFGNYDFGDYDGWDGNYGDWGSFGDDLSWLDGIDETASVDNSDIGNYSGSLWDDSYNSWGGDYGGWGSVGDAPIAETPTYGNYSLRDSTPAIPSSSYSFSPSTGGPGLQAVGRGQMGVVDDIGTRMYGSGFSSVQDLLGSGTKDEIARYTPGSAYYGLDSGKDGLGLTRDATRGMSLTSMGGGQGLTSYEPPQFGTSALDELVKANPGAFPDIEDYLNKEVFGGEGLRPFTGSGGNLTSSGFLSNSSMANPLGATYALGDPNWKYNRPSVTGNQAVISPGQTVIAPPGGTNTTDTKYKVITETPKGDLEKKLVDPPKAVFADPGGKSSIDELLRRLGLGNGTNKSTNGLATLLPLLLMMLAANKDKGGATKSNATIPSLSGTQKQTPYTQIQQAPGYRPGQGGITYFEPMQYVRRAAGGGIGDLAQGGRLLHGPGDGVSDSIPAKIGTDQPARLARGEYVIDARTVAALGNGSTDAGAERLDAMRKRILSDDRKAQVGKDSKAYRHLKV